MPAADALFGEDAKDFWILGDSATRIKKNGKFVYESLISNEAGQLAVLFYTCGTVS
jgi:hypothetical protein